ncbi:class I SAM-dependent RNA methyltransferase [Aliiruegeria sabulilitoris]|uniref:class I SAM-dependent RNA methyltransferase n=1 Tax=Aliiruegeria sabulilitoris TaxID=1510458 RepID=UPI00082A53D7|nr:class I SAM-dependent RNA methyltransferase [Aliiruegeria sabulilitoris]NDR57512.1 class I SAM-dependent RNA methyltransferase [Pseudoruegeria sp. M32A2M]
MSEWVIERLGHLGDGIAAGPVFAQRCLPGERITGRLEGDRIEDVRILEPSPHRVSPPCRHFKSCGGCAVQHADDAFVAEWKLGIVRTALEAHGLETEYRPVHSSPARSRRRAVFSGRRTKRDALIGFHGRASDVVIDVPGCVLVEPALLAARPALAEMILLGGSRKGELSFTVTLSAEGPDIAVSGGKPLDLDLRMALAGLVERHGLSRLSWGDEVVGLRAAPRVDFDGIAVTPPPGAFLQATRDGETALLKAITEAVGSARQAVDLFAGCGTFTLPLARHAELHAVEGAKELTDALIAGWRNASGLKHVSAETRDLFRRPLLPDELRKFEAAIIDPPRAGALAQTEQLAASGIDRVAAVSCNPVTFARDAGLLVAAGFRLDWVQVVDQFRWSTHVELAASFSRDHIGG